MIGPRRSPLVGRGRELAALRAAAVSARDGRGGLVLVHGEAGVGKSRLCRELTTSLSATLQLRGQTYPGDDVVSQGIAVDTLRTARREPDSALWAEAQRRAEALAAIVPELLESGSPVRFEDDAQLFETVLDTIEAAAAGRLALWVVEDVQWADEGSWRLLHYCARRAVTMNLLLLVTYRDDESLPDHPAWARMVIPGSRPGVTSIPLRRLSPEDTVKLVRDVSERGLSEAEVHSIAARSGGTPLLVEELVTAREALGGGDDPVPAVVRATARERSRRAGERARALLDLAAVMGHDADIDLLVDLRPEHAGALETLVSVGLLRPASDAARGSVEFRHPLLREAAYEDIPWERRRLLHAEAAAALTGHVSAQSAERIARHWELAGRPGHALDVLLDTIATAQRQDNVHRAAALGLLALALIDRHRRLAAERPRVVSALIEDLFAAGRWTPLLPLLRAELAVLPRGARRRMRLLAILGQGEVQGLGTTVAELRRDIDEALAFSEGEPPSEDRALLLYGAGMVACAQADPERTADLAERSLADARACGAIDVELRAHVVRAWAELSIRGDRRRAVAELRAAAVRARAAGRTAREASLVLQVARVTFDVEDIALAEKLGQASVRWYEMGARCLHALVLVFAGEFDDAERVIGEMGDFESTDQALWMVRLARAFALTMQGKVEETHGILVDLQAASTALANLHGDEIALSGWAAWESERFESAAAAFEQALVSMRRSRIEPGFGGPYFIALHLDALCRGGRADVAEEVFAEQSPLEDRPDSDRFTRASFAAGRFRLHPSPSTLAAAVEACRAGVWPWLEGLCGAWAAELLGDAGAGREARTLWWRLRYAPGIARLDRLLGTTVATKPASAPHRHLTSREETVADLIAEGLTNAEIAARLGISAVTVAHHVSSVLDKLGVGSRTQVAVLRAQQRSR